jgi:hypothetical protein
MNKPLKVRRPGLATDQILEEQANSSNPVLTGPITGKEYRLTPFQMPSNEIQSKTSKSTFNLRFEPLLNVNAVADILPSIREDKRNQKPVLAVGKLSEKIEIIEGMRRTTAVSFVEGASLIGFAIEEPVDELDIQALAGVSDMYEKPTTIEFAIFLKQHPKIAERSMRDLHREYGYSVTTIARAKKVCEIPQELLALFPTAQSIPLVSLLNLVEKYDEDSLIEAAKLMGDYQSLLSDEEKEELANNNPLDKQRTLEIGKSVIAFLISVLAKPKTVIPTKKWIPKPSNKAVKVAQNDGAVTIKLGKDFDFSAHRDKLVAFIESL